MKQRLVVILFLACPCAVAATLTIGGPGDPNNGDCAPFGCELQYQQVYGNGLFSGPIQITGLTFFNDNFVPGSISAANYTISLSTTASAVDGLSSTFADNLGADNEVFFSGALGGLIGPTNQFTINGTPFSYDPSVGNLLLTVTKDNDPGDFSVFLDVNSSPLPGTFSRAFAAGNTGVADEVDNDYGLVTQFTYTTTSTATPEPKTAMLLGGGLLLITIIHRSRRVGALVSCSVSAPRARYGMLAPPSSMRLFTLLVGTGAMMLLLPPAAGATPVTYTYIGNPLTTIINYPGTDLQSFSPLDIVDGTFTVSEPFAANFAGTFTPVDFDFTVDGLSWDYANSWTDDSITDQNYFYVGTDSLGNVTQWIISLTAPSGSGCSAPAPWWCSVFVSNWGDVNNGEVNDHATEWDETGPVQALNSNAPGALTAETSTETATPEPSSALINRRAGSSCLLSAKDVPVNQTLNLLARTFDTRQPLCLQAARRGFSTYPL